MSDTSTKPAGGKSRVAERLEVEDDEQRQARLR